MFDTFHTAETRDIHIEKVHDDIIKSFELGSVHSSLGLVRKNKMTYYCVQFISLTSCPIDFTVVCFVNLVCLVQQQQQQKM